MNNLEDCNPKDILSTIEAIAFHLKNKILNGEGMDNDLFFIARLSRQKGDFIEAGLMGDSYMIGKILAKMMTESKEIRFMCLMALTQTSHSKEEKLLFQKIKDILIKK